MAGPIGQVNEMRAELDKIRKQQAEEAEAKAIKNKDFQSVIDGLKAQIQERDESMKAYQNQIKNQEIDGKLFRSGIKDDFARTGVLAHYNSLEEKPEIDVFIAGLKDSHASIFQTDMNKGKSSGNPGVPTQNKRVPISVRLESKDPAVVKEALEEQFALMAQGKPVD